MIISWSPLIILCVLDIQGPSVTSHGYILLFIASTQTQGLFLC